MNACLKMLGAVSFFVSISLSASEWFVATNGTAEGQGTKESPWSLLDAVHRKTVKPGETIWISGGTYKFPDRKRESMGYDIRLAGSPDKPIRLRAIPGQRVTIDGGLNVQPPSTCLWIQDLEIVVSENLTKSRRFEEAGSHPQIYDRPWGGLTVSSGENCKFINLIIHDNAQGVSWWTASSNSELHGCIIYDNGWDAPDRGHGHAIYTQNNEGVKTISDCIMTGGHSYTMHAYGSKRADVNNYLAMGNIVYRAGPFLIGGGKPSRHIRVLTNCFYGVPVQIGYTAPTNEDCEVVGNFILKAGLSISKYREVKKEDNTIINPKDAGVGAPQVFIRRNQYDTNRYHVAVFNPRGTKTVDVAVNGLRDGQKFRLLNPTNMFGPPVLTGTVAGKSIQVPMTDEFAAFVLLSE